MEPWRNQGSYLTGLTQGTGYVFYRDTNSKEYSLSLNYRWRKFTFVLEYSRSKFEEYNTTVENERLYLNANRYF